MTDKKKKTTLTGRFFDKGPELQNFNPVYSNSGRNSSNKGNSVVLDYNFSQAEARIMEDMKKGEYYGPQVSGKSTLLSGALV